MVEILAKEELTPVTWSFVIRARAVARRAQAGQFVMLRSHERAERIPLTIADYDRGGGTITLVVQAVGKTTMQMGAMEVGDQFSGVTGPLGRPSEIADYGTVVCIGGGFAIAPVFPIARALRQAGNTVLTIVGVRSKELLFWERRLSSTSEELIVCTEDGSYGYLGLVTHPLKELLDSGRQINRIWAIGPAAMMKFCALTSLPYGVPTVVNLNSIMVDGTGMCGACRVEVGGKTRFACVDGPEFDGHQVNWDLLLTRQRIFVNEEKEALARWQENHGPADSVNQQAARGGAESCGF